MPSQFTNARRFPFQKLKASGFITFDEYQAQINELQAQPPQQVCFTLSLVTCICSSACTMLVIFLSIFAITSRYRVPCTARKGASCYSWGFQSYGLFCPAIICCRFIYFRPRRPPYCPCTNKLCPRPPNSRTIACESYWKKSTNTPLSMSHAHATTSSTYDHEGVLTIQGGDVS